MQKNDIYSEDDLIKYLSILNKISTSYLKFIVSSDGDDRYIPNFDFEYYICNCKKNWYLGNWEKYFEMDKPVVFINTSEMFRKIKDDAYSKIQDKENLKKTFITEKTGAGIWAANFYHNYRDKLWHESKSKFLIILKDSDILEMCQSVNAGFSIELCPLYFSKNYLNNSSKTCIKKTLFMDKKTSK